MIIVNRMLFQGSQIILKIYHLSCPHTASEFLFIFYRNNPEVSNGVNNYFNT